MVKKLKKMAESKSASPAGLFDSALAGSVKDSAQQIWLAGMGAFAKAQEGGTKVFESLIKEGMTLQRKTQAAAEEKIGEISGKAASMAEDIGAKAGQQWDKLESIFEQRTAKALAKLGVPTAAEVAALQKRVDELAAALGKQAKAAAPKAAGKTAAKTTAKAAPKTAAKAAPKRAAARKAA